MNNTYLSNIRDIAEILFYVTIIILTFLTYLKARKSILEPLKTKLLNNLYIEINDLFRNKSEENLLNIISIQKILLANSFKIKDLYESYIFNYSPGDFANMSQKSYNEKECPESFIIEKPTNHIDLRILELFLESRGFYESSKTTSKQDKSKIWKTFKVQHICLPKKCSDFDLKLSNFISYSILPKNLIKSIQEYQSILHENLRILAKVLTEYALELPNRNQRSLIFDWDRFFFQYIPFKGKADEITNNLNSLLNKLYK